MEIDLALDRVEKASERIAEMEQTAQTYPTTAVRATLDRIEGRKIHIHAEMHHGEVVAARARGVFISVPQVFPAT